MCSLVRITVVSMLCLLVLIEAHQDSNQWSAQVPKMQNRVEGHSENSNTVDKTENTSNAIRRSRKIDSDSNEVDSARAEEDSWWPSAEFAVLQKVYDDCSAHREITTCLKSKALNALSRAVDQESIQLTDGLVLVKQNGTHYVPTESRGFAGMSSEDKMDIQLKNKFQQLFNTHTLTMDLASEGRGKGKKVLPYLLLGVFTTVSVVGGIALKTLAAIAGKALIASKVALTIAGIIALKKLFSHDGGHGETTFQVHADGHNRRNYYVVRPARQSTVDPYRYYYDQSMPSTSE